MSDSLYLQSDVLASIIEAQFSLQQRPTSGTPSSLVATKLLSLRPAYLRRCEENSDSIDCAA